MKLEVANGASTNIPWVLDISFPCCSPSARALSTSSPISNMRAGSSFVLSTSESLKKHAMAGLRFSGRFIKSARTSAWLASRPFAPARLITSISTTPSFSSWYSILASAMPLTTVLNARRNFCSSFATSSGTGILFRPSIFTTYVVMDWILLLDSLAHQIAEQIDLACRLFCCRSLRWSLGRRLYRCLGIALGQARLSLFSFILLLLLFFGARFCAARQRFCQLCHHLLGNLRQLAQIIEPALTDEGRIIVVVDGDEHFALTGIGAFTFDGEQGIGDVHLTCFQVVIGVINDRIQLILVLFFFLVFLGLGDCSLGLFHFLLVQSLDFISFRFSFLLCVCIGVIFFPLCIRIGIFFLSLYIRIGIFFRRLFRFLFANGRKSHWLRGIRAQRLFVCRNCCNGFVCSETIKETGITAVVVSHISFSFLRRMFSYLVAVAGASAASACTGSSAAFLGVIKMGISTASKEAAVKNTGWAGPEQAKFTTLSPATAAILPT